MWRKSWIRGFGCKDFQPDVHKVCVRGRLQTHINRRFVRHELRQLFRYAKTEGIDMEEILSVLEKEGRYPVNSKREGKEVIDVIRQRLI